MWMYELHRYEKKISVIVLDLKLGMVEVRQVCGNAMIIYQTNKTSKRTLTQIRGSKKRYWPNWLFQCNVLESTSLKQKCFCFFIICLAWLQQNEPSGLVVSGLIWWWLYRTEWSLKGLKCGVYISLFAAHWSLHVPPSLILIVHALSS